MNAGPEERRQRLVIGITGASGAIFGVRLLERLSEFAVETHLVVSAWGARTIRHETKYSVRDLRGLVDFTYKPNEQGAPISSGSFLTDGMIIAPCSVKTLAAITTGCAEDLISRSADVTLKERRRLVLVVRESPYNQIHLENMLKLTRMGVVILPPVPGFYNRPSSIDDVVDHIVARVLDQVGLHLPASSRWNGQLSVLSDETET